MITSLSNKEQYGRIFSSRKVIEVILKDWRKWLNGGYHNI